MRLAMAAKAPMMVKHGQADEVAACMLASWRACKAATPWQACRTPAHAGNPDGSGDIGNIINMADAAVALPPAPGRKAEARPEDRFRLPRRWSRHALSADN